MHSSRKEMSILEHIRELRSIIFTSLIAFVVACIVAFGFANQILSLFIRPFSSIESLLDTTMVVSTIVEGFVAQLKISVITGFIVTLPVHIFGILRFVFPGLTGREKKIVMSFLVFSLILIVIGAYLVYFQLVPLAINFLTNPHFVPSTVGFVLNYKTNVFYLLTFILWAVLALQLPLVMEILLALNVLKRRQVWKATRYIIVGFFILAALVTPPDVISQIGVAVPLIIFHFLALLIAKIFKFGEG